MHQDAGTLLAAVQPAGCVFLYPYRDMQQDALVLLEAGITVFCSGPLGLSAGQFEHIQRDLQSSHLATSGVYRFDPGHAALKAQREQAAFGEPVFMRAFAGGGDSFHALWWRLYDLLERTLDLIGSPLRSAYIAVNRGGTAHQAVLHAQFAGGAQAQLTVAPSGPPHPADLLLLGSGGLVSLPITSNQALLLEGHGHSLCPTTQPPVVDWLHHALVSPDPHSPEPLGRALLLAMRHSLHEKAPCPLRLEPVS
jgi:predicted dehydrogenase